GFPVTDAINDCSTGVPTVPSFADVVVIRDESGSMFAAQQFSVRLIASLDAGLAAKGVGVGGTNQFGLVGYGGGGTINLGHVIPVGPNNAPFGTAAQYGTAAQTLVTSGFAEDGYAGMDTAFKGYQLRQNSVKFMIL